MADKKISDLTALTGANVADTDLLPIVDTSATETKKITFGEFKTALDTATGFVRITGDTMTGNLSFGDNNKAIFGDSSDLQIYHDVNVGTIALDTIKGDADDNTNITFAGNDTTTFYQGGTQRLAVNPTGINVTGTVTADGLTVDGNITSTGGDLNLATLDLNAISDTIAVTAVDVFVYDTSKDSDGGAWRKRTQGTSWYNEALGTSTRGARREFPAVAVIVAETNKVTIYDGDDPDLPMWMVFNQVGSGRPLLSTTSGLPSSVSALNGIACIGLKVGSANDGQAGIGVINFISEVITKTNTAAGNGSGVIGPLIDRNLGKASNGVFPYGSAIVNNTVNDVAMTVLPNAPIDPATGLPVPTIAVATAGGVSVIKDDGTVQNLTGSAVRAIAINDNEEFIVNFTAIDTTVIEPLSTTDTTIAFNTGLRAYSYNPATGLYPFIRYRQDKVVSEPNGLAFSGISGTGKLQRISEDFSNARRSLLCDTTSTYNTGWMNGNIKGAFLSDTDDTDLVGTTPLEDDFSTYADTAAMKAAGWSSATSTGTGDISLVSGAMQLDCDGTANRARGSRPFTTVVGQEYVVEYSSTLIHHFRVGTTENGTQNLSLLNQTSGTFADTFVATATTTYVTWEAFNAAGNEPQIDNISVKLADADRSVNNKGLIVNGTVTKNPVATGADLVAYSGFSASNYLEQPYNSGLNFGTGDFCYMGWLIGQQLYDTFFVRSDGSTTSTEFMLQTGANAADLRFYVGGGFISRTGVLPTIGWHHLVVLRESGTIKIYSNGVLVDSFANTSNVTQSGATLIFGDATNSAGPASGDSFTGSLALWRISATAPTAEQIAKIYNDEKYLFQAGAQATLYGASDAVTALAYDDATDLLHVGTSGGRSVFQGLRRVSNTAVAVGTAISASNGLVVEE
jgi:trimeric autotransporter adhesin